MKVYKEFSSSDRMPKSECVSAERGLMLVSLAGFIVYLGNALGWF